MLHSVVTIEVSCSFHCPIHQAVQKYYYNKIYSSLRTFSATSFKSLSTTSSIMESAMLIISNAFFISGSARGSYGFGGKDSSAEVGKQISSKPQSKFRS
jgi:hypothetical protein